MKSGSLGLILTIAAAGAGGALLAVNPDWAELVFLLVALGVLVALVARKLITPEDSEWLPKLIAVGYLAKVVASALRFAMVTVLYEGGDAFRYHRAGVQLAETWRDLQVPVATGGSAGTRFTEVITSLMYVPNVPSMLGGFFIFATLAFIGQVFLYAAFRTVAPSRQWRIYALLVLFVPTLLFWPSSIGKESLMLLSIGVASYGLARVMEKPTLHHLLVAAAGVAVAGAIRPHMAVLVVGCAALTLILSRRQAARSWLVSGSILLVALLGLVATLSFASDRLGVSLDAESVEPFVEDIERRTEQGGSAVQGDSLRNPIDFPEALLRVLFRPLPHEAHNAQAVLSSVESLAFLVFTVWRLPAIVRNFSRLRRNPYLLFSLLFVVTFVVLFSPVLNLGILARQRSLALPFLLAVLVGVGRKSDAEDATPAPNTLRGPSETQKPAMQAASNRSFEEVGPIGDS